MKYLFTLLITNNGRFGQIIGVLLVALSELVDQPSQRVAELNHTLSGEHNLRWGSLKIAYNFLFAEISNGTYICHL